MISRRTAVSEVDSSDSEADQACANGCTENVWSSAKMWSYAPRGNTSFKTAMERLQNRRENRFINELITSISRESLSVSHDKANNDDASVYDDEGSEYSVQTEETEVEEPNLFEKVGQVIESWKSEVDEIAKSIAHKKAMLSKSRTDHCLKSLSKAKAERERIQRHEDRFVKFVELSGKKLDCVTTDLKSEETPDTREFDVRYRPMRLIELNDLDKDNLTAYSLYKSTFSRLSKQTACWITSNTQDEEVRQKLQTALKEVHGQVDLSSDFWDPSVITDKSLKLPARSNQPKNAFREISPGANLKDEDVPALVTSRPTFRPQLPDLSILSAKAFQEFQLKSNVSKILEPAPPARDYWDMPNLDYNSSIQN